MDAYDYWFDFYGRVKKLVTNLVDIYSLEAEPIL